MSIKPRAVTEAANDIQRAAIPIWVVAWQVTWEIPLTVHCDSMTFQPCHLIYHNSDLWTELLLSIFLKALQWDLLRIST